MGDRSNVSHRVLNTVRTATGAAGSLENFIGLALVDGAQCFVTEEEANYRWLSKSVLVPDGRFVVKASGPNEQGRWVRETGLVGFAMLEDGEAAADEHGDIVFGKYKTKQLVQFEMTSQETLVYRGATRRLAMLFGNAHLVFDRGSFSLAIRLDQDSGTPCFIVAQRIELSGPASVACSAFIEPGARLSLEAIGNCGQGGVDGSLHVVLA